MRLSRVPPMKVPSSTLALGVRMGNGDAARPCPSRARRATIGSGMHPNAHAHDHDAHLHHHSHDTAFAVGTLLNAVFVVVEGTYGIVSHSMALLADAGHNLSDVAA